MPRLGGRESPARPGRIEAVDCAAPGHALRDCRLAGGVFFHKPGALFAQCVVADADGRFPGDAGYAYVDQRLRLPFFTRGNG